MPTLRLADGVVVDDGRNEAQVITLEEWERGVRPEAGRFVFALPNDADVERHADAVRAFGIVALHFPGFRDGRAYSQARILRDRLKFAGELRATGDVASDQAQFLARAGFDAVEIGARPPEDFRAALGRYSNHYQAQGAVR
jgi:uncharacterized protein (DUF934 family)